MEEQKIRKVIIAFYIARILSMHITLTYGVYVLMLKHNGLNLIEINAVNVCFMVAVFLFEVPTGSYADAFGHKKSFVVGLIVEGIALIIYFLGNSFWSFVVAEVVLAFASALQSGSLDAWAVNNFKRYGWKSGYSRIFSRAYIGERLATLALAWIGAKIGHHLGLSWPFLIAGIAAFVSAIVIWPILSNGEQSVQREKPRPWQDFKNNIAKGRKIIVTNDKLALLFGICFIIAMMVQPVNMQWAVLYEARFLTTDLSTPVLFQVLGTIIGAVLVVEFCRQMKTMVSQLMLIALGIGVTIFAIPLFGDWGLFMAVLFVHEIPRGMLMPIQASWVGELVEDNKRRATVNSYFGMIWTLAAVIGLVFSGFWAEWFSIQLTWALIVIIGFIFLAFFLLFSKRKQKRPF